MTGNLLINECPSISYFQAERMLNFHDADATNAAIADAWGCEYHHDPNMYAQAAQLADSRARKCSLRAKRTSTRGFAGSRMLSACWLVCRVNASWP